MEYGPVWLEVTAVGGVCIGQHCVTTRCSEMEFLEELYTKYV